MSSFLALLTLLSGSGKVRHSQSGILMPLPTIIYHHNLSHNQGVNNSTYVYANIITITAAAMTCPTKTLVAATPAADAAS